MKNTPKATAKKATRPPSKRYYFAYGSNTNLDQMSHRCPGAKPIASVMLNNYTLGFNGKSNGWGVANVRRRNGSAVQGVLWEIAPECERSLDVYEGFPALYTKKNVTVTTDDGTPYKAMMYVMTKKYCEPAIPSKQYYKGICEGFRQNALPLCSLEIALDETYDKIELIGGRAI